MQYGQREVAPAALRLRHVHLQDVLETEQLKRAPAVVNQAVERGQQRGTPGERLADRRGVDPPCTARTLDLCRLTGLADHRRAGMPRARNRLSLRILRASAAGTIGVPAG